MVGHASPSLPPISARDEDGVRIVALTGEHDLGSTGEIAAAFSDAAARGGPVLADLTGATFIDSSVIAELVAAHELSARTGFAVAVSRESQAARVLSLGLLHTVMPILDDTAEALRAARAGTTPTA